MIGDYIGFMRRWRTPPALVGAVLLSLLIACTSADSSASPTPQGTPYPGDPTVQPSTPGPTAGPTTPTATPVDSIGGTGTPTPTPQPIPTFVPLPADALASEIADFKLEDLIVPLGTTVVWTNLDGAAHTTTAGASGVRTGEWDSGSIAQNSSFTHTFDQAGTFAYYCTIHRSMTATVIVIETPSPPGLATPGPQPTATPTPQPTATATPMSAGQVSTDIASFQLEDLAISVGTTVTWTNLDAAPHTATSGPPNQPTGQFDSGTLSQGMSGSHTFAQAGTFAYYGIFHPSMTATVTVTS